MKSSTILKFVLTLTLLTGCQNDSSKSSPAPVTADSPAQTEQIKTLPNGVTIKLKKVTALEVDLSNIVLFKENLNQIEATFQIPEEIFSVVNIERVITTEGEAVVVPTFLPVSVVKYSYQDGFYTVTHKVNPWTSEQNKEQDLRPRNVTFKVYTNKKTSGTTSMQFTADMIVPEATSKSLKSLGIFTGTYELGVAIFEQDSTLQTEGSDVSLEIQKLIAKFGAKLETFSADDAKADPGLGQVGRSGGKIILNVKSATGDLKIYLRGKAGGQGKAGEIQTAIGGKGDRGANGTNVEMCHYRRENEGCYDVCGAKPTDGGTGLQGPQGLTGGIGMTGGSSGSLELTIEQKVNFFSTDVVTEPGSGGPGGDGGIGGGGGPGGDPGSVASKCTIRASSGAAGPIGETGLRGNTGPEGTKDKFQIKIENDVIAGEKNEE